jgi:two-component sensor histidine kinase
LGHHTSHFFQPTHVEILQEVAASLSIALQQARLLEQTQQAAETNAMLLDEVNHRVLNNLTMILSILDIERRRPLDDAIDFQTALKDVASRIQGMITVHRMLSSAQWAPLDLGEVVTRVVRAALSGSPIQHRVEVIVEGPDAPLRVTPRQAITVALVVNELTTNSAKYAFHERSQGRIHVQIIPTPDDAPEKVRLVFRDDGPGMPDDVLTEQRHNVGLWLVQVNATRNLGGEVEWWNDDGAVVAFTFALAPLD